MKNKKISIKTAKLRAWKAFSEYIRKRDAFKNGVNQCITCGKLTHWSNLQAGHFLDGRGNSILFDEKGCWPQCVKCNVFNSGSKVEYTLFMLKKYGQNVVEEMRLLAKIPCKMSVQDYQKIEMEYKSRIDKKFGSVRKVRACHSLY